MRSIHVLGVIKLLQKVCLKKRGSVLEVIEDFSPLHIVHFALFIKVSHVDGECLQTGCTAPHLGHSHYSHPFATVLIYCSGGV